MAQHDYVIANGTGAAVRSDLNNALAAIVSQNSGATEPATTYAYQFWADTTTNLLKLRNSANSAWITLFQLDGEWSTLPVENGTAAAPSIYFKDSGTDTGFYSPGTDQVGISTGGTARLTIDANGNLAVDTNSLYVDAANNRVGIGTSSPGAKLVVDGGTSGDQFRLGTDPHYYKIGRNSTSGPLEFYGTQSGVTGYVFGGVDGTRLTIDSSGRVGIGVTSPGSILDINGPITLRSSGTVRGYLGDVDGDTHIQIRSESGQISFKKGNNEIARFDTSSRFLLGTSSTFYSTEHKAYFAGDSNSNNGGIIVGRFQATAGGSPDISLVKSRGASIGTNSIVSSGDEIGKISFRAADGTNYIQAAEIRADVDGTPGTNDMPGRIVLSTTADGASSPTERMRIDRNGNVAVGGTGSSVVRLWVLASTTDSTAFAFACYNSSSQDLFYIRNDGLIFTGLRTNSPYNLTVSNAANCHIGADGVLYRSTSSIRFKTDVEDLEDQYADAVLSCRPVWFRSTASGDSAHPDWGYWGFIAEEVAEIDPRLVFWKTHETIQDEDGNKTIVELEEPQAEGVQYDRFVPHLVNLLNRQKEQIESQGAAIAALEARLSALETA